jgi:hypothetical protein
VSHGGPKLHSEKRFQVIVGQIEKECAARDATLERYLVVVRMMENYFRGFFIEYIEKTKNTEAGELA